MSSTIVGLDLGSEHIRAVEVKGANTAKPIVVRFDEIELPPSAMRRGEVVDVAEVSAAIRQLWSRTRFGSKQVVLGIGGPRVMARELSIPAVPLAHIREALPFQVQDTLPMPVEDALLDFYPVSETESDQGDTVNGLLVAAVRETVVTNVHAATLAGLRVVNVDFVPFALVRALAEESSTSPVLYVSVGARTTNLVVAQGTVPLLVRTLPSGGDDIDAALMTRFSCSAENAHAAKFAYGMSVEGVPAEQRQLVTAMVEAGSDLFASIRDTASYFQTSHPQDRLSAVKLCGGGSRLRGFSEAFQQMSGLEAVSSEATSASHYAKSFPATMSEEARDNFTVAFGLAVGSGF